MPPLPRRHLTDADRQRLLTETKSPISWNTGASYSHLHYDLSSYQTFHSVARPPLFSKAVATQILVDFLKPLSPLPSHQQLALSRIDAAWRAVEWDPSLVIKAMADLDTVFFAGRLKGSVVVVWASEDEILEKGCEDGKGLERGSFLGLCQPLLESGELRCKVWLDADAIFDQLDPREHMWQTVLHELVHAYALISSERSLFTDYHVASSDPCHDDQFNYLLSMVDRRSMYHLQMPARPADKVHTICLNCHSRPLMQGDEEFGMDEHGQMLKEQKTDPKWDQGGDEGAKQSASSD